MALMCNKLWGDRGAVADLPGPHMSYMAKHGLEAIHWNLFKTDAPFCNKLDFVFFVEVIEHLPIPGYVALERLRRVLWPGGVVICTTPNLYSLRDVVFIALGARFLSTFDIQTRKSLSVMSLNIVAIISIGKLKRLGSPDAAWNILRCTIHPKTRSIDPLLGWGTRSISFRDGATI